MRTGSTVPAGRANAPKPRRPVTAALIRMTPPLRDPQCHPREPYPPFDLAYSAAMLSSCGIDAEIVDNTVENLSSEALARHILDLRPDFVIATFVTASLPFVARVIRGCRAGSRALFVAIGPHVTYDPASVLSPPDRVFDLAVMGEPEQTIVDVVSRGAKAGAQSEIPGTAWYDDSRRTVVTARRRALMDDLDSLPFIPRDKLRCERYQTFSASAPVWGRPRWGYLLSSRGCPFQCTFCSPCIRRSVGNRFRAQSPARVAEEMEYLVGQEGVNIIDFKDDVFSFDMGRVHGICEELLRRRLKVKWAVETHLTRLDRELLLLMKRAGCCSITVGVESGSDRVLALLRKGITVAQIRDGLQRIRAAGIAIRATAMVGLPTETLAEMQQTLALVRNACPYIVQLHYFTPYAGSAIAESLPAEQRPPFGDYRHFDGLAVNLSSVPTERIQDLLREFYRRYYLRPRYLLEALRRKFPWAMSRLGSEAAFALRFLRYLRGRRAPEAPCEARDADGPGSA